MNTFKILFVMWACSTSALAQDYYAPTDKEKEPAARFPLSEISIRTNPNGEKYITYDLPLELTGEKNTIVASEVKLPGLDDLPHNVRIFSGPKATVTCMGTDERPGCMVTHRNLNMDPLKAYAKINETFYDPQMRADAQLVVDDFQDLEHSGNQPIGVLGGLKLRKDSKAPAFPTGEMETRYEVGKSIQEVKIRWSASGTSGSYNLNGVREMVLTDIKYVGNRARGRWGDKGQEPLGWFEFNFNSAKTRFEGYFGQGEPGSVRKGRWSSSTMCNFSNCKK